MKPRESLQATGKIAMAPVPSTPSQLGKVATLVEQYREVPGGLLPLLHAVQDEIGYVAADAVGLIANGMNLSRAEVHGVITYYHHFRDKPAGRHVVQVCRAEACQACGADELLEDAKRLLNCDVHGTSADKSVSLEPVYCLGLCASSPAIMVDEKPHARMTADKLARLAGEWAQA